MTDDEMRAKLEAEARTAFKEMEAMAKAIREYGAQLEQTPPGEDYDRLKDSFDEANRMAIKYQSEMEEKLRAVDRLDGTKEKLPTAEHSWINDWDGQSVEASQEDDSSLRPIADKYLINIGTERRQLSDEISGIEAEAAETEISPDHHLRAQDILLTMEAEHHVVDRMRTEDETIRLVGESHMAQFEAEQDAPDITPPPPPPESPNIKMRR